jgi:hypothetical protein
MRCINTLIRGTSAMESMSYSKVIKCCFMILNEKSNNVLSLYCTPTWSSPYFCHFYVHLLFFRFVLCTYFLFFPCLFHVHLCTFRPYGNPRHAAGTMISPIFFMSLDLSLPCPWASFALSLPYPWAFYCPSLLFPCPVPELPLDCPSPVLGLYFPCPVLCLTLTFP